MPIKSINPVDGQVRAAFPEMTSSDIHMQIEKSHRSFLEWKKKNFARRRDLMQRAAQILTAEKEPLGRMIVEEMGKPIRQARAEIEKCAWVCEYYAENAARILHPEKIKTDASESYVRFDPLGIVLAVMPWNYPFWQVFRFAAPTLMAGNVCLLKHASSVPRCALRIEEIFQAAGFPPGVFKTMLIGPAMVEAVIRHSLVRAVTFTGSESAGKKVAELAGRYLKKTVLELGGSDPFIVLADADLESVVRTAVESRAINNGESCIAAKRFIVVEEIAGEFEARLVRGMRELRVGDPIDESTDLGPLARPDLVRELDRQVNRSVESGAKLLTGGRTHAQLGGNYYEPTVLGRVEKGMPAYHEELFGPVAAVIRAENERDAVRIANDTDYGLGASLWTRDIERAKRLTPEIDSGLVFVNGMVKSDPRLPFGGVKSSGYGRELSDYGIREFVNIKTVWIGGRPAVASV